MLISKEIKVKWNSANKKYYESKGYSYTKIGDEFDVKVEDLSNGSNSNIQCLCDYCLDDGIKTIINKPYYAYLKSTKQLIKKDCCKNCWSKKQIESNQLKYGVNSTSKLKEIKEKQVKTCLERYGVENPLQNKEIYEKSKKTNLERYGVEHALQNKEIHQKAVNTTIERYGTEYYTQTEEYKENQKNYCLEEYGVENIFQLEECKEKIKKTNLERYGVEYVMQNKKIKDKAFEAMYQNGTQKTSKQQKYIYDLIINNINNNYELNYFISRMFLDIANIKDKIYIEYDGGFHKGNVIMGNMTEEEFNLKEMRRSCQLSDWGWKEVRIISESDLLPKDEVIIKLINYAIQYVNLGHHWIKFDIDNSKIINSLGESFYDYGTLRKISNENIEEVII
jgi:hypothetical protein